MATFRWLVSAPWRWLQWMLLARPIRFTRFGVYYVLFAIGVGAAAINTGNNLLYLILGLLLAFIVLSGFLSDSCLWGTLTSWRPLNTLYAGQAGTFICEIQKGRFPGVTVNVQATWQGADKTHLMVPWVTRHAPQRLLTQVLPHRRGLLRLKNVRASTRFPFGLFEKSHTERRDETFLVFPRLDLIPWTDWPSTGRNAARPTTQLPGPGAAPYMLRNFQPGDPARLVDWKQTAKRRQLMVKEMEDESSGGNLLVVKAWPVSRSAEELEDFISFIASAAFAFYERQEPIGLSSPGTFFRPDHSRRQLHNILSYLALVDPANEKPARSSTEAKGFRPIAIDDVWRKRRLR